MVVHRNRTIYPFSAEGGRWDFEVVDDGSSGTVTCHENIPFLFGDIWLSARERQVLNEVKNSAEFLVGKRTIVTAGFVKLETGYLQEHFKTTSKR